MRNRNSAAMIGSVRSKSKSAAFSISTAKEGRGVAATEAATRAAAARDLGVREREIRGLVVVEMRGSETGGCGSGWCLDLGVAGAVIRVLEEAMITLAMVD